MNNIPRESLELVGPLVVTALDTEGQPVPLTSLEVTIKPRGARPTSGWETPLTVDGALYVLIGPPDRALEPGGYIVWGRLTDSPETPVFKTGELGIT